MCCSFVGLLNIRPETEKYIVWMRFPIKTFILFLIFVENS